MDERFRELGEPPGYEFDWLRAPASEAGPGRPARLARDTVAAMRARNWVTRLAAPLLAAVAVGVAVALVLGANGGADTDAPSALAAGFPPARSAVADFGAGPVQLSAVAAADATEVAAGSANRAGALWVSADGGSSWRRAVVTTAAIGRARAGQFAGVAHGRAGWLAVGAASASGAGAGGGAPLSPAVVGSPDGRTWTAAGGLAAFDGSGPAVTAAVAAGPGGYVIVGHASAGPRTVAAAWYAPSLTGWRRGSDATSGALDGPGNRVMNAVTAVGPGFVAVGAVGAGPAAWLSGAGRTWTLVTPAAPAGAVSAALDYVAASGEVVTAVGTEVTAAGQRLPFAAVSTDAGAAWTTESLPVPDGAGAATALTAAGGGFTATGTYGPPGQADVVVWTLPAATAGGAAGAAGAAGWTEATPQGTGLTGPGVQAITALTSAGATLTGVGFTATSAATSATIATEPTIWQSTVRS